MATLLSDLGRFALALVEIPAFAYLIYRCVVALFGLPAPRRPTAGRAESRFLVLVPAHNEAWVIGDTVSCILGLDYPTEKRRVVVVADACSDRTAAVAAEAGAGVLERSGPASGKGETLRWALNHPAIRSARWTALVVFDADSRPRPDFLRVLDAALAEGAEAIQARSESQGQRAWIARGYAVNTTQRNRLWHQARERAGFSAALTGTGLCLSRQLLDRIPWRTSTLTEDLEYFALLTASGVRVRYLYEAVVQIEQPVAIAASVSQRLRWARGQLRTTLATGPALLWRALTRRDLSALDSALYVALPSLVPLQAAFLALVAGYWLLEAAWLLGRGSGLLFIPPEAVLAAVGFSLLLPSLGLLAERRRVGARDWLFYLVLMATWIPVALFAALTMFVHSWVRTPREAAGRLPTGEPLPPKEGP